MENQARVSVVGGILSAMAKLGVEDILRLSLLNVLPQPIALLEKFGVGANQMTDAFCGQMVSYS